jgi:acyl carrier protein
MVPTYLVPVDAVPLTANGKIDRNALPPVDTLTVAQGERFAAPNTMLEAVIADTFAGLLGHERVSVDTGFFDLGGNSLQAMQLVTRLRADLAVDLDVTTVFLAPTSRQLAAHLREKQGFDDVELDAEAENEAAVDAENDGENEAENEPHREQGNR